MQQQIYYYIKIVIKIFKFDCKEIFSNTNLLSAKENTQPKFSLSWKWNTFWLLSSSSHSHSQFQVTKRLRIMIKFPPTISLLPYIGQSLYAMPGNCAPRSSTVIFKVHSQSMPSGHSMQLDKCQNIAVQLKY